MVSSQQHHVVKQQQPNMWNYWKVKWPAGLGLMPESLNAPLNIIQCGDGLREKVGTWSRTASQWSVRGQWNGSLAVEKWLCFEPVLLLTKAWRRLRRWAYVSPKCWDQKLLMHHNHSLIRIPTQMPNMIKCWWKDDVRSAQRFARRFPGRLHNLWRIEISNLQAKTEYVDVRC